MICFPVFNLQNSKYLHANNAQKINIVCHFDNCSNINPSPPQSPSPKVHPWQTHWIYLAATHQYSTHSWLLQSDFLLSFQLLILFICCREICLKCLQLQLTFFLEDYHLITASKLYPFVPSQTHFYIWRPAGATHSAANCREFYCSINHWRPLGVLYRVWWTLPALCRHLPCHIRSSV